MYTAYVSERGFLTGYSVFVKNINTGKTRAIARNLGMWEAINLRDKFNDR